MPVPSTAIFITILLLSSSFRWRPARAVRQFDPAANRGIRGEPAESFFPPPPHSPGCVVPSSARPSPPEAAAPPCDPLPMQSGERPTGDLTPREKILLAEYAEVCKSHAGITEFRAILLSLRPIGGLHRQRIARGRRRFRG